MEAKRIDFSLFSEELKALINTTAKIFPVSYAYVVENINPLSYEYVRIIDTEHKNEIYIWDNGFFLIGADDIEVFWEKIKGKPLVYPPATHEHSYAALNHTHGYALAAHTHLEKDMTNLDKYTKAEVDNKISSHIHDERYSTKTEVNALLANKSDIAHNHDGAYYKKPEVDSKLLLKADINIVIGTVKPTNNTMWYKEI